MGQTRVQIHTRTEVMVQEVVPGLQEEEVEMYLVILVEMKDQTEERMWILKKRMKIVLLQLD